LHNDSRAVSSSIRVILSASDLLTDGIKQTLSRADDILLRLCPLDLQTLVRLRREFEPHLILLEHSSHLQSTMGILQRLHGEGSRVTLMVIAHELNPAHVRRLLGEGARGYLLASSLHEDLASSIRLVVSGKTVLSPSVADALLDPGD
jgi:DNA-binding NarL/FixJ family response regulator